MTGRKRRIVVDTLGPLRGSPFHPPPVHHSLGARLNLAVAALCPIRKKGGGQTAPHSRIDGRLPTQLQALLRAGSKPTAAASPPISLISVYS